MSRIVVLSRIHFCAEERSDRGLFPIRYMSYHGCNAVDSGVRHEPNRIRIFAILDWHSLMLPVRVNILFNPVERALVSFGPFKTCVVTRSFGQHTQRHPDLVYVIR